MRSHLLASSTALALAAGLSTPALALDDDGEIIVVTAVRVETDAARLPASVSILNRSVIELEGLATLADALQTTPGLTLAQSGPAGSLASVFIRGANSKHTLALFDGIRINDPSTATGVFNFGSDSLGDAARVEIVRGPLSSLYGSDAVGGVINILPRRAPERGVEPFAELAVGEFDTYRALAGVGFGSERARGVISVEGFETGGFDVVPTRLSTASGDPDAGSFSTLSANGSYDLTEQVSVEALVRVRSAESAFDTFSGGPSGFQRSDDRDLFTTDDQTVWSLGLAGTFSDGAVTGRLRGGQVIYDLASFNGGARTDVYEATRDFAQLTGAWRLTSAGPFIEPLLNAGLELQTEDIRTDTAFNDPLSVAEDSASVFAAGQAGLTQALTVTASVRFDDYETFGGQTTANIGAVYALDRFNTRLRASYGTSFKAPTLSERFASSGFITPNPGLVPEEGDMAEIGFDTTFDALTFGAAYYDGQIENLIETVFDFTTFTGTNENIGAAELSGLEAYARWTPVERLTLSADYTYTDATNADTGARLLRRPEHAWSARAVVRPTETTAIAVRYARTGERLDVTYDDDGFFLASGAEVDAFETVSISGTHDLNPSLQAFASLTNALDETYEQPAAFAGAPRSLTVGLRWRPGR